MNHIWLAAADAAATIEPEGFIWIVWLILGLALVLLAGLLGGWAAARHELRLPRWLDRLLRPLGLGNEEQVTEEDLYELVDDADEQDLIDETQKKMITNIIELDEVTAGDIMTHRMEIAALEESSSCREAIDRALESGNSRLPVYRKNIDEISGILYVKDLLCLMGSPERLDDPVAPFCRPATFVPESRPASELMLDFKNSRSMIAIVVDEYGGTAGLVSMEDILEEIVGDIQDEFDDEEADIVQDGDGFAVSAALDLEDLYEAFDMECPATDEDEFDTVGGLVTDQLGRVPKEGERAAVEWGGLRFEVLTVGERHIQRVHCTKLEKETEE